MPDWEEIVRCDGPVVWRTAYRLLNNSADADECFQETFVAALEVSRREAVGNWRALLLRLAAVRAVYGDLHVADGTADQLAGKPKKQMFPVSDASQKRLADSDAAKRR